MGDEEERKRMVEPSNLMINRRLEQQQFRRDEKSYLGRKKSMRDLLGLH